MSDKPQPEKEQPSIAKDVQIDGDVAGDVTVAGRDIVMVDSRGIFIQGGNVTIKYVTEEEHAARKEQAPPYAPSTSPAKAQDGSLTERDWDNLLRRIKKGKCTPFLGPGVGNGRLPTAAEIAAHWAEVYQYPDKDIPDLARVAQFLATQYDPVYPKEELLEIWFEELQLPDFSEADEPHAILAQLPLPIYITTNYDRFMLEALKLRQKGPLREFCRWNNSLKNLADKSSMLGSVEPDAANPIVYHLYGNDDLPESLVLTEDDFFDFLVNISADRDFLPTTIRGALAGTSLLFLGYTLNDWRFRVMYRGLIASTDASLRRISVTVQLPPESKGSPEAQKQQEYIGEYFQDQDIRVYWGTAREFLAELKKRWKASGE